jgi:hypothetical protein
MTVWVGEGDGLCSGGAAPSKHEHSKTAAKIAQVNLNFLMSTASVFFSHTKIVKDIYFFQ